MDDRNVPNERFEPYRSTDPDVPGFYAGLPSYPRNFTRDVLVAGLISQNVALLTSQLRIAATHQADRYDAVTGAEPGKIHHEYPGFLLRAPYLTTYNACDTTALFIIAAGVLKQKSKDVFDEFMREYRDNIDAAARYLLDHLRDGLFWESPPGGAQQYSLRVTYWKDSILPNRSRDEPEYPVAFALVQFQVARAFECAAQILDDQTFAEISDEMFRTGIDTFITSESFCVMQDATTRLVQSSSDELHSLFYIPTRYGALLPIDAIRERAHDLITEVGFACTPAQHGDALSDKYHGYVVWPFEQALISEGCKKFGLDDLADIAARVRPHIASGHEYFEIKPEIRPAGNGQQLWSEAAGQYFESNYQRK
jgi:glycogen debranching enzyme